MSEENFRVGMRAMATLWDEYGKNGCAGKTLEVEQQLDALFRRFLGRRWWPPRSSNPAASLRGIVDERGDREVLQLAVLVVRRGAQQVELAGVALGSSHSSYGSGASSIAIRSWKRLYHSSASFTITVDDHASSSVGRARQRLHSPAIANGTTIAMADQVRNLASSCRRPIR